LDSGATMGLEEVKQEVLLKGKKEADEIMGQAGKEAEAIISDAKERIRQMEKKNHEGLQRHLETMEKKELTKAKFEVKKLLFEAKKEIIDDVFDRAKNSLLKIKPNDNRKFMKSLLKKAQVRVKYIYTNKRDKGLVKGFSWKEEAIAGGIILENADKSVRIDYSYNSLLEQTKENCLSDLAKLLF